MEKFIANEENPNAYEKTDTSTNCLACDQPRQDA